MAHTVVGEIAKIHHMVHKVGKELMKRYPYIEVNLIPLYVLSVIPLKEILRTWESFNIRLVLCGQINPNYVRRNCVLIISHTHIQLTAPMAQTIAVAVPQFLVCQHSQEQDI